MRDVWCSWLDFLYELRGDQRYPIWVISDIFNDIPKLIPGGSSMYKASYKKTPTQRFEMKLIMFRPISETAQ